MKKSIIRKVRKALQCSFCSILVMAMVIEPMPIMAEEEVATETCFEETDVDKTIDDVEEVEPIEQSISSIQNEENEELEVLSSGVDTNSSAYTSPTNPFAANYTGQCTWYAWGRAKEKMGVELPCRGEAKNWINEVYNSGRTDISISDTPKANSILVVGAGCNCDLGSHGHVSFVEYVSGSTMHVSEHNYFDENGNYVGYYESDMPSFTAGQTMTKRYCPTCHASGSVLGYICLDPTGRILGQNEGAGRTIPDGDYQIVSALDNELTLDIPGNDIPAQNNGDEMQVWHGLDRPADIFHVEYLGGEKGFYKITQKGTNQGIVVGGPSLSRSAKYIMWDYYAENLAFQWSIINTGDGYYILQNRYGGFYLDIESGDEYKPIEDGRKVIQWDKNYSSSQKWGFASAKAILGDNEGAGKTIADGDYVLVSALDDTLSLDIGGNNMPAENGAVIQAWHGINRSADFFHVEYLGGTKGYYKITQKGTSQGLVIGGPGLQMGATNCIWEYFKENLAFQWSLIDTGGGYYILKNRYGGYCLDIESGDEIKPIEDGRAVIQWERNDSNSQKWKLLSVKAPTITTSTLPNGIVGKSYSATITAESATPITWTYDGKLPPGLSFSDGKISGNPTTGGTYSITVKAGNTFASTSKQYSISVTVPVTSVGLNKSEASLKVGDTTTLTATVNPSNATNKSVTWSSTNTNVATVDNTGKVTAKAGGEAKIIVKTADGGKTAECKVTVTVPVISVGLNKSEASLKVGETTTLTATVNPSNAANKSVTWSSNNTNAATVDSNGKVTAKAVGTADITVKTVDGGKTATCKVTVLAIPTTSLEIDRTEAQIDIGDSFVINATVKPDNATNKKLIWVSDNTNIATVDENGRVTGKSAGKTDITVRTADSNIPAVCTVTVGVLTESISLKGEGRSFYYDTAGEPCLTISLDGTGQMEAVILPENVSRKDVEWKSSDTNIVQVSSTGVVTGVAVGTAVITATTKDTKISASCKVNVIIPAERVILNQYSLYLPVDGEGGLVATVEPGNATDKNVTWTVEDDSIASVDTNGKVKGLAPGTTKIYVTPADDGKAAVCEVTVFGSGKDSSSSSSVSGKDDSSSSSGSGKDDSSSSSGSGKDDSSSSSGSGKDDGSSSTRKDKDSSSSSSDVKGSTPEMIAAEAARKAGFASIEDTAKIIFDGGDYTVHGISGNEAILTLVKGNKIKLTGEKKSFISNNKKVLTVSKKGKAKAKKETTQVTLGYVSSVSHNKVSLKIKIVDPRITGGTNVQFKKLKGTVGAGQSFDIVTNIPLNADFIGAKNNGAANNLKTVIGEDGAVHITGDALDTGGKATIPFMVNGKKFKINLIVK